MPAVRQLWRCGEGTTSLLGDWRDGIRNGSKAARRRGCGRDGGAAHEHELALNLYSSAAGAHRRGCAASSRSAEPRPSRREPPEEDKVVHVQARFGIHFLDLEIVFFPNDWMQIWRVILVVAIFLFDLNFSLPFVSNLLHPIPHCSFIFGYF